MPFIDDVGDSPWSILLSYAVQEKGRYVENWTSLYYQGGEPIATNSTYTVLTYPVQHYSNAPDSYALGNTLVQIPAGGQVDFQVEALIGYFHKNAIPLSPWFFVGQTSSWSNTQTITIPTSSTSVSQSPAATVPEFPSATVGVIILMAITASILFIQKKQKK